MAIRSLGSVNAGYGEKVSITHLSHVGKKRGPAATRSVTALTLAAATGSFVH